MDKVVLGMDKGWTRGQTRDGQSRGTNVVHGADGAEGVDLAIFKKINPLFDLHRQFCTKIGNLREFLKVSQGNLDPSIHCINCHIKFIVPCLLG